MKDEIKAVLKGVLLGFVLLHVVVGVVLYARWLIGLIGG